MGRAAARILPRLRTAGLFGWLLFGGWCPFLLVVWSPGLLIANEAPAPERPRFSEEERSHWAFQPIRRPEVPAVRDRSSVRTPIDAFVIHELEAKGLSLAAPADKRALLRRISFDLAGLPPTPVEMGRFLQNARPDALEQAVDRLLASPHYGEAWARHWLDVVRYAETAGYNADPLRPLAYKYRDYVIRAFNCDTPYNRFIQEQIAGDELFPDQDDALLATGYDRLWPDESNASDVLLARQDALNDLTSNVGSVFLGLSIGCAQCHDHKFDPILQSDFYRLQAFFAGIVPKEKVALGTPHQLEAYRQQLANWVAETDDVRNERYAIEAATRAKVPELKRGKFPPVVLQAIDLPPEHRTAYQHQLAFWSERQIEDKKDYLLKGLTDEQKDRLELLKRELADRRRTQPKPPRELDAMVVVDDASEPPAVYVLRGGSYEKPAERVGPGFPAILMADNDEPQPESSRSSLGSRAELALWLSSPANPLTARVMVNRIWLKHFGTGLVENANDLGFQSPEPTHKALLDWLATEFIANGYSVKAMHRLIMSSAVYQQSSRYSNSEPGYAAAVRADPENSLYWHYPERRLSAEAIRDSMLAVSGELNTQMFGLPVRPELPPNFSGREKWKVSERAEDRVRRSVYIHAKRNLPYPMLKAFDLPDMHENCACRTVTTVAPQALLLLNSDLVIGFANSFAQRLIREHPNLELEPLIADAYESAFARKPQPDEIAEAIAFLHAQESLFVDRAGPAAEGETSSHAAGPTSDPLSAAVADFCHVLLNANEFLYLD